jgi:hypothetical protein
MSSAQVHSLEKLLDFQASLATFGHQAAQALDSMRMEIRRTLDWVDEQLKNWHAEIRRAEEAVFKARQELAQRRMMRVADRPADTAEQEIALAKAQHRLEHAQEKHAACRRWLRELPDAIAEYDGHAVNYQSILESDMPRMAAFLDRKMDLLEAYAQVSTSDAPPAGDNP